MSIIQNLYACYSVTLRCLMLMFTLLYGLVKHVVKFQIILFSVELVLYVASAIFGVAFNFWEVMVGLQVIYVTLAISRFLGSLWFVLNLWRVLRNADIEKRSAIAARYASEIVGPRKRDLSKSLYIPDLKVNESHSHGMAAAVRTAASYAINDIINILGFKRYSVSRCERDEGDGSRCYYSVRDLVQEHCNDPVTTNHIISMIDVDYYVDMEHYMSYLRPILMYTFVPIDVAGDDDDAMFTIKDDTVTMHVDGGATYEHKLWDYSDDFYTIRVPSQYPRWDIRSWFDDLVVFEVEKISVSPSRRIIGLFPRRRFSGFTSYWLPENPIRRLSLSKHDSDTGKQYNVLMSRADHKSFVSVGEAGSYSSVRVELSLFEAIRTNLSLATYKTKADVERLLNVMEVPDSPLVAPILFAVLRDGVTAPKTLGVAGAGFIDATQRNLHYQVIGKIIHDDGKEYARVVAPPLVEVGEGATCPVQSLSNDQACIDGRVNKVHNVVIPPGKYTKYAQEFAEFVVPDDVAHTGVPVTLDEVVSRQTGPLQRMRNAAAQFWMDGWRCIVRAFQKKECYAKYTDPRNISTVPTGHTLKLSSFAYGFKNDCLKAASWYLPCLSPSAIAGKLYELVRGRAWVVEKDYSRFDGTISRWLREHVEQACYLRWVSPHYREELSKLLNAEVESFGFTQNGVFYRPDGSRLSGSPVTTDGNGLINAFDDYCAGRENGLCPAMAYACIGLVYGDDGVSRHPEAVLKRTARDLGLVVKVIVRKKNGPVALLGRVFPDPWSSNESVQDPLRTISKLHISVAPRNVDQVSAACNRVRGYLVSDPYAPIISQYCRAVLRCYGQPEDGEMLFNDDISWSTRLSIQSVDQWPQSRSELIDSYVADALGLPLPDMYRIIVALNSADNWFNFPVNVIHAPRNVEMPVRVGGNIITPPKETVFQKPAPPRSVYSAVNRVRIAKNQKPKTSENKNDKNQPTEESKLEENVNKNKNLENIKLNKNQKNGYKNGKGDRGSGKRAENMKREIVRNTRRQKPQRPAGGDIKLVKPTGKSVVLGVKPKAPGITKFGDHWASVHDVPNSNNIVKLPGEQSVTGKSTKSFARNAKQKTTATTTTKKKGRAKAADAKRIHG